MDCILTSDLDLGQQAGITGLDLDAPGQITVSCCSHIHVKYGSVSDSKLWKSIQGCKLRLYPLTKEGRLGLAQGSNQRETGSAWNQSQPLRATSSGEVSSCPVISHARHQLPSSSLSPHTAITACLPGCTKDTITTSHTSFTASSELTVSGIESSASLSGFSIVACRDCMRAAASPETESS